MTSPPASRHTGRIAAAIAVLAFALGSFGAYQLRHKPATTPIILRQAIQSDESFSYDATPGTEGMLVLLRNDGTTPVEVIDAAFSRTTAAPPLYIAPSTVAPGGEVNVFVTIPGACVSQIGMTVTGDEKPVQIMVNAHLRGDPVQSVPVELTGPFAAALQNCRQSG